MANPHGKKGRPLAGALAFGGEGGIRYNPSDACELPRVIEKPIKPIEGDNIAKFLNAIKGHRYETLYPVTLFTGIRQGEALGLTWDIIDLFIGTISINKQLRKERTDGGGGKYRFVLIKND